MASVIPASLVVQMVKNLPAMQEIHVWSLGREDALERGIATHSRILAWRIPWTDKPGGLQSMGSQRVRHDWDTKHTHIYIKFDKFYFFRRSVDMGPTIDRSRVYGPLLKRKRLYMQFEYLVNLVRMFDSSEL